MKISKYRKRKTCATPANQPRSRSNLTRAKRKYNRFLERFNYESFLLPLLRCYFPGDLLKNFLTVEPLPRDFAQIHYMNKKMEKQDD